MKILITYNDYVCDSCPRVTRNFEPETEFADKASADSFAYEFIKELLGVRVTYVE